MLTIEVAQATCHRAQRGFTKTTRDFRNVVYQGAQARL
jgi:hypothetical protein